MTTPLSFSTLDLSVFLGYFLVLIVISIIYRAKKFNQIFGEDRKPHWLMLAASLLMIEWSPMTDMMSMGIILENGYSSLWILKDRFWLAGAPAILFASMWSRLSFKTDNELLRLRYSGKSAVVMHVFRAIFLSIFVIPLFASFIILALKKLLLVISPAAETQTNLILSGGVLLLMLKNSFHQKIRTDTLNALICITAPILVCFSIFHGYGGADHLYDTLRSEFPKQIKILPSFELTKGENSLTSFFVFICVQWWSVYIIDNSDPNAQRHLQAKNRFHAFKALFLPILLSSLMFLAVSVIWDCGILEYNGLQHQVVDKEAFYLEVALKYVPNGLKALVILGLLISFITTLESIINWGAGLLTVDICKTYFYKDGSDQHYRFISFAMMFLVSTISLVFAFNNTSIFGLQKFIFSISAGVAPVFLLRWFWWRINAWTQLSAMLSSLVYTLIFDLLYEQYPVFKELIDRLSELTYLGHYPLKLIVLTALVVITWLVVMYSTQPDDEEHLKEFVRRTGTGGIWPQGFPDMDYQLSKKILLCLVFAVTYILPYFFIWQFKFGSSLYGFCLLALFIILAIIVYKSMSILLKEKF